MCSRSDQQDHDSRDLNGDRVGLFLALGNLLRQIFEINRPSLVLRPRHVSGMLSSRVHTSLHHISDIYIALVLLVVIIGVIAELLKKM